MSEAPALTQVLVLLGAIVVVVPLIQRLGLGSVPGYLLAGTLIGPSALGLLVHDEAIASAAELGVVFLMFAIGIELSPQRLWLMRRLVFGLGGGQLFVTAVAVGVVALAAGVAPAPATIIGFGIALSSTALVLQVLGERRELGTSTGRAALAVLLFQDVAVAPLVSMVYLLGEGAGAADSALGGALRSAAMLIAFVLLGRWLLRRALPLVASSRNPDVLVAMALLLVLGAAVLMHEAGFSHALGAFIAGVLLADSPFRHQVVADLHPFRGILLGVFFLTFGMRLDVHDALDHARLLIALTAAFMAAKALLLGALARAFGLTPPAALRLGLQLSQGGEFALVLFALALNQGLLTDALHDLLAQMLVLSLLISTPVFTLSARLATWLERRFDDQPSLPALDEELSDHVVICGFGRVGSQIANLFDAAGRRWVAAERSVEVVRLAQLAGLKVYFGDASRPALLRALRIEHAALAVVTLDDTEAAERCVHALRTLAPNCRIVARSADMQRAHALREEGAARAVPETVEYSLQLGLAGLVELDLDAGQLQALEDGFRDNDYEKLLANRLGLPMRR